MLFSTLVSFTLLGIASATPTPTVVEKRDLSTFTAAFAAVSSAITDFDSSVTALTASSDVNSAITDLTTKSNTIISALNTGAANINATTPLDLSDAVSLLTLSNNLVAATNQTVNDLIAKKSIIDAANEDAFVVTQLTAVRGAAYGFIGAVVSQVPSSVQSIANTQASQVITVLNSGITAFGGSVSKIKRTAFARMAAFIGGAVA